eukprot:6364487-Amphidinium_carterae.1
MRPLLRLANSTGKLAKLDFQGNQEADEVANLGAAAALRMLSMSLLLSTFVGSVWLRRSESFGFWWLQSFESEMKPGSALGCLRRPRTLRLPRLCRWM